MEESVTSLANSGFPVNSSFLSPQKATNCGAMSQAWHHGLCLSEQPLGTRLCYSKPWSLVGGFLLFLPQPHYGQVRAKTNELGPEITGDSEKE